MNRNAFPGLTHPQLRRPSNASGSTGPSETRLRSQTARPSTESDRLGEADMQRHFRKDRWTRVPESKWILTLGTLLMLGFSTQHPTVSCGTEPDPSKSSSPARAAAGVIKINSPGMADCHETPVSEPLRFDMRIFDRYRSIHLRLPHQTQHPGGAATADEDAHRRLKAPHRDAPEIISSSYSIFRVASFPGWSAPSFGLHSNSIEALQGIALAHLLIISTASVAETPW